MTSDSATNSLCRLAYIDRNYVQVTNNIYPNMISQVAYRLSYEVKVYCHYASLTFIVFTIIRPPLNHL